MKPIIIATFSVVILGWLHSFAADTSKTSPFRQILSAIPAAEVPAKAAELVKTAKTADCEHITVEVVETAVDLNSTAAPSIVGAIARAVPAMAPVAAGSAAARQPKQAAVIARSAADAAPKMAAKIVSSVCRAAPNDFRNVAMAVAETVPGFAREILVAVGSALPELKASIDQALAGYAGQVASVETILDSVKVSKTAGADPAQPYSPRGLRDPTTGPPYLPPPPTPVNIPPSGSGNVPPGGRDYAAP